MNPSVFALLGYIAWTLGLLSLIVLIRVGMTLSGKRAPNKFATDGADVSPFTNRLCRAHANCYEHFPVFGGLLLLAIALDQTAITDGLAGYFLGAKVLQSLTHLVSSGNLAVQIRFAFFFVQLLVAATWIVRLAQSQLP